MAAEEGGRGGRCGGARGAARGRGARQWGLRQGRERRAAPSPLGEARGVADAALNEGAPLPPPSPPPPPLLPLTAGERYPGAEGAALHVGAPSLS
jgi:hypothetical protein